MTVSRLFECKINGPEQGPQEPNMGQHGNQASLAPSSRSKKKNKACLKWTSARSGSGFPVLDVSRLSLSFYTGSSGLGFSLMISISASVAMPSSVSHVHRAFRKEGCSRVILCINFQILRSGPGPTTSALACFACSTVGTCLRRHHRLNLLQCLLPTLPPVFRCSLVASDSVVVDHWTTIVQDQA